MARQGGAGGGRREGRSFDARLVVKSLAHPVRRSIFDIARERVISPSKVARELGLKLSETSRCFRQLRDRGALELVDRKEVRGAVEHFYRATPRAVRALEVAQGDPAGERDIEIAILLIRC